jgi:hypothetical protein
MTLTNSKSVGEFLETTDPIRLLTDATEIKFTSQDDVFISHQATSGEIKTCLSDLKVCFVLYCI